MQIKGPPPSANFWLEGKHIISPSSINFGTLKVSALKYSKRICSAMKYRTVQSNTEKGSLEYYIILNNGILKLNSSIFPRSEGYITQYTP